MSERTEKKVALVTGASSGFGMLTSVSLAAEGFRVFASMRDLGRRERLDAAARAANVQVGVVQLDVTDESSILAAVAQVKATAGRIDVLVNNAGYGITGFFEDISMTELREQMETNFFGLAAVTRAVLPAMRELKAGRVINVSSIAGRLSAPTMAAYSASKFAVEGLSEGLRFELADFGISVILIEPGMFKTDIAGRNQRSAKRMSDPASPYYEKSQGADRMRIRGDKSRRDPQAVADAIVHAATVTDPRLRYLVGLDAKAEDFLRLFLPERLYEAAVHAVLRRAAEPE